MYPSSGRVPQFSPDLGGAAYSDAVSPSPPGAVKTPNPTSRRLRASTRRTLLLPPWTRAPRLSLGRPAVLAAVFGAAAVMACAAASAPLFLSSAGSESLRVQLAGDCPDAAFPVVQQIGFEDLPGGGVTRARDVTNSAPEAIAAAGLPEPYRVVQINSVVSIRSDTSSTLGQVFYRDDTEQHIILTGRVDGAGLLLPAAAAASLDVTAGGTVQIGAGTFAVAGVYRDLFTEDTIDPFWCSYRGLFRNEASGAAPAALILTTSADIVEAAGNQEAPQGMARSWVSPIDTAGLTLTRATDLDTRRGRAFAESGISNQYGRPGDTGTLPELTVRTQRVVDGLRGPVVPIAAGGALLALLLVAAAGSYWADRRAGELRLLTSRGVGPAALGVKAALEMAAPAVAGTAAGWGLARLLVAQLGPSPVLDAGAPRQAALAAAAGLAAAVLLLAVVAAARASRSHHQAGAAAGNRLTRLPWELLLIAAAAATYARLRATDAVVLDGNVAQINLLLISFPLLLLAGVVLLVARLLTALTPPATRRLTRWPTATYLALRRIAGARLASALLLAAVGLPVGVLTYSATLTATTQVTLEAKARVVVGSDRAVISVDPITADPALDDVGTVVARYDDGDTGGQQVTVLAVDPSTFDRFAFWDDSFAATPLPQLMDSLADAEPGQPLQVVAAGLPAGPITLTLGDQAVSADVIATVSTLPGRRQLDPVLLVDQAALGEVDRSAGRVYEVWTTRGEATIRAALPSDVRISRVLDRDSVFEVANFLSVSWSFGYLQALAALIGAVGLGGLLLYLEARQRSRAAAYALTRRMGLSAAGHLRSLLTELSGLLGAAFTLGAGLGWLAVLSVYRQVEIDPNRPPGPLLTTPDGALTAAATATVLVAAAAALYAQHAAARTPMAQVLRLGS